MSYTTWIVAVSCIGCIVLAGVYGFRLYTERNDIVSTLESEIREQRTALLSYTETVSRNGVDDEIAEYVPSCSTTDRREFEQLLGTLDTASESEIERLQILYPTCGRFFALQKQALVQRLEDGAESLVGLLHVSAVYDEVKRSEIATWQNYIAAEQDRADAFSTLVSVQEQLIDNQIEVSRSDQSDEMLLVQARAAEEVQDEASVRARNLLDELQTYAVSQ